ncbi:two-component system, OmpR family, sensor kinase [Actinomyces ruminicola]|uniref:histidine kinase n=1 Tax=Actinomyces ruminicola TaxID=332524 RepID=A0A1H0B5G1_9ACTO|nr:HAMP domain-containing sensor histidine kinase [Actinomyces ruminicola]SDN40885.1 two-component system, OmpR family, sensor kinase [Actinomyces ruminicola]
MSAAVPRDMRGTAPGIGRPDAGPGGGRRAGGGRLLWLWWGCAVVAVVVLTILAQVIWGGLNLYVTVGVPAAVGATGTALLLAVALAALARTRRRNAEQRLRETVQEESRNRHRQFLRRLDHELKNPLTAVRAAVADASRTAAPAVAADLEVVDAQSRRMSRLLTDLRKLAELETAPLALEDVDLAETVQDAVSAVIEEAAGRGAAVRVRLDLPAVPWPLPHVRGDGDLLYSAVYNVIANAAKYTPHGGAVEVRGREEAGAVTIEVADTGIGVPEADLARVFHELERAGNARALPGSGLGLALVRTIVSRHGGQVRMASREGVGTRVWLTLPVMGPSAAGPSTHARQG